MLSTASTVAVVEEPGERPLSALRSRAGVPPLRETPQRRADARVVVARVVESDQAHANRIAEVEDVQARGRLIEPIAIAPRVDAEQAAEEQPDRRLVRDEEDA